ncbi:Fc.00g073120.m01.CDS01 [Cosmosporella sp. VM-42]
MATSASPQHIYDLRRQPLPSAPLGNSQMGYASSNTVNGCRPLGHQGHGQSSSFPLPTLEPEAFLQPLAHVTINHGGSSYNGRGPPYGQEQRDPPRQLQYYTHSGQAPQAARPLYYEQSPSPPDCPALASEVLRYPLLKSAELADVAPITRTSIACSYCRQRKIRCSGYQNAPRGKCGNCARMKQRCVFQPVSSSSTAFIPVSVVPGGAPPGAQLVSAYGQPLAPIPERRSPAEYSYHSSQGEFKNQYLGALWSLHNPPISYNSSALSG